jgi:hypothetical protein
VRGGGRVGHCDTLQQDLGLRPLPGAPPRRRAYRQVSSALPFVPMSTESFGRLGAPALMLLGDLADQAVQAGGPGLSRAAFIWSVLRELSVVLCQGNASLCRSGAYLATRAAGRTLMSGLARPSTEVVKAFFCAPCVGLGFLVRLCFALRCVALLCAMAPSFVSGWRAFASVCLCKNVTLQQWTRERAHPHWRKPMQPTQNKSKPARSPSKNSDPQPER